MIRPFYRVFVENALFKAACALYRVLSHQFSITKNTYLALADRSCSVEHLDAIIFTEYKPELQRILPGMSCQPRQAL